MEKKNNIPMVILFVGIALMIISFFIPYLSATEEYAKIMKASPDTLFYADTTNREAVNISLFDVVRMYYSGANMLYMLFVFIPVVMMGIFSLLNAFFSFFKKPVAIIVFNTLSLGIFVLFNWDFQERGLFAEIYNFSIAYYLVYIAGAVIFAGSVWMLIDNIRDKRRTVG